MANWSNAGQKQNGGNDARVAYIDSKTREMMDARPDLKDEINARANAALETAKDLMGKLTDANLVTYRKEVAQDEQGEDIIVKKLNKAAVRVIPAEDKDGNPIVYEKGDNAGKQILWATITISDGNDKVVASVRNDASISSISASKWHPETKKMDNFRGAEAIANSSLKDSIKGIAAYVVENGLVTEHSSGSGLFKFAQEANEYFAANRPLVDKSFLNEETSEYETKALPDTYARYSKDDNGYERVTIRSDALPYITVDLGITSKGDHYAQATNWTLASDGVTPRDPDTDKTVAPAKLYINNKEDLDNLAIDLLVDGEIKTFRVPEIEATVSQFKGFDEKEQKKAKNSVERD